MTNILITFLLLFIKCSLSQENSPYILLWHRQIANVMENERRLLEYAASQKNLILEEEIVEKEEELIENFSKETLNNFGVEMSSMDYINMANEIIEKFRINGVSLREGSDAAKSYDGRNYLNEARRILGKYNNKGKTDEIAVNSVVSLRSRNIRKTSKTEPVMEENFQKILRDGAKTKEGLRAIAAEIIRRKIEELKTGSESEEIVKIFGNCNS